MKYEVFWTDNPTPTVYEADQFGTSPTGFFALLKTSRVAKPVVDGAAGASPGDLVALINPNNVKAVVARPDLVSLGI